MSAAITAVAIGAAASAAAAAAKAKADKKANQQTIENARQTNAANTGLSLAERGGPLGGDDIPASLQGQRSALLPLYFGAREANLGDQASSYQDLINGILGTPANQYGKAAVTAARFDPSFAASEDFANRLATGDLTNDMLAEAQPVYQARAGVSEAKRNAGLEALKATLNEIDQIQAGKGYSGDSTGSRMLRFNARRAIGTSSAADFANDKLANAMDTQGIQNAGRTLRLQNLSLPGQMETQAFQRENAPLTSVLNNQKLALEPFQWFKMGPANYNNIERLPAVDPVTGSAQIVGQTIGSLANAGSDYLLKRRAADAISRSPTAGGSIYDGNGQFYNGNP